MKILFAVLFVFFTACSGKAQDPVSWSFSAKKIADKTYEVTMTANLQQGWHLYSQTQPEDAIAIPTEILFIKNPLLSVEGKTREVGKMEKYHDKTLDLSANQYSGKVAFVQVIKVKGNARTKAGGTIEYQTCNDVKCLPPKKVSFNLALN
ncbi:MAG: hypothetical protein GC171_05490 [Terrimonas sp.]|nr:hypothetical protein [Terrimonas sp.]